MELSLLRIQRKKMIVALLALAIGASTLHAAAFTPKLALSGTGITGTGAAGYSLNLSCSYAGGTTPVTGTISPVTAIKTGATLAVGYQPLAAGTGLVVTAPTTTTLSPGTSDAYVFTLAPGCVGVTTGTATVTFTQGGTADVVLTVHITGPGAVLTSGLSASTVTVNCSVSTGVYSFGAAQTVTVTSSATGGTPFTVDTTTNTLPGWLKIASNPSSTTANPSSTFTVQAQGTCNTGANASFNIHLLNAPANDALATVNLVMVPSSILQETPKNGAVGGTASLSYTKGSGIPGTVDVTVTATAAYLNVPNAQPFFTVDTTSLPSWLNVDSTMGTTPKTIRFTTTNVADSVSPGTYNQNVRLNVAGYGSLNVPISALINNQAPKLTATVGTLSSSYIIGQAPIPSGTITLVSSDSPIPFSLSTSGALLTSASPTQIGRAHV